MTVVYLGFLLLLPDSKTQLAIRDNSDQKKNIALCNVFEFRPAGQSTQKKLFACVFFFFFWLNSLFLFLVLFLLLVLLLSHFFCFSLKWYSTIICKSFVVGFSDNVTNHIHAIHWFIFFIFILFGLYHTYYVCFVYILYIQQREKKYRQKSNKMKKKIDRFWLYDCRI